MQATNSFNANNANNADNSLIVADLANATNPVNVDADTAGDNIEVQEPLVIGAPKEVNPAANAAAAKSAKAAKAASAKASSTKAVRETPTVSLPAISHKADMESIARQLVGTVEPVEQQKSPADMQAELLRRLKCVFMNIARSVCPDWTVRPEHREAVDAIFHWCMGIPAYGIDPAKGLWLFGNNGTGKTTMLEIVRRFCYITGRRDAEGNFYGFRTTNVGEVCGHYMEKGYAGIKDYCELKRQAFDELGSEAKMVSSYGTPLNVMQYILQRRYEARLDGAFTHVTTNLSVKEIAKRYGVRIFDRCKEMFNFVCLDGSSYRPEARVIAEKPKRR